MKKCEKVKAKCEKTIHSVKKIVQVDQNFSHFG